MSIAAPQGVPKTILTAGASFFAAALQRGAGWPVGKSLPIFLFVGMIAVEAIWNSRVGISWTAPSSVDLGLAILALGGLSAYAAWRSIPVLAEIAAFILICILYPIFGERLSYLAATLNAPLVDQTMHMLDACLGFDWQNWAATEMRHPQLLGIQRILYESHFVVALGSIIIFAVARPGKRNYELLLIYLIGFILTLILFAIFPTTGPASLAGQATLQQQIIQQLRSGHYANLAYDGIVSFPSYHTLMAIAVIYSHRGIRLTFYPMLLWNGAMLFTVPFGGDHYLVDMVAGGAIAAMSIAVTHAVSGFKSEEKPSAQIQ